MQRRQLIAGLALALFVRMPLSIAAGGEPASADRQTYERMVSKAIGYLETKGQSAGGSYSAFSGPAVTALATTALIRHGRPVDSPAVAKGIEYLKQFIQKDGGIYEEGTPYRNYETCVAIVCFNEVNDDGRYDETLKRADAFVRGIQWDETEGIDRSDFAYGGAGYGKHNRPDLSNTSFFVDALHSLGHGADDPALQRAVTFISRCQNMESEHNRTPWSTKSTDGGFYYTPAAGGKSQAGTTPNGGLRSYGSMTYAGLKSMIFAGVDKDDSRVEAALEWIRNHYELKSNPGMGHAGLYYYYHTFAKALATIGEDTVVDESGETHDWRADLITTLAQRQRADGSWVNQENERWLEGDPNLVTAYALLALSYCGNEFEE